MYIHVTLETVLAGILGFLLFSMSNVENVLESTVLDYEEMWSV